MRTLFILNRQEEVVGLLKNGGATLEVPPYFDDLLTEDLATGAKTFQFTTMLDNKGVASNLVVGNYIAFQKDEKYELFQIMQTEEDHQEAIYINVYCECAGLELINSVVRKKSLVSVNVNKFLATVLEDTSWDVGFTPYYTEALDIELQDESVYAAIQNNIASYGVEIDFRVEIVRGKIANKYIDVYEQRGRLTGKRFEFGKDIEGIQRKTDLTNVYTALIGVGKDDISFKDVTVDGIEKPLGQDFVANQEAYERYNNNGYHIMGVYKYDTDSPEELLRKTYEYLQECNEPKIEYTVDVALLGHLLDESWNTVSIGDTVCIVDNYFNPPIQLMARINKLETSETNSQNDKCTFTNFVEVQSNITAEMRQIASELEGYVDAQFPIGSDKIQDGAITAPKIPADAIITSHLQAGVIVSDKIQANQIEAKHLQADSVTADKIQAGSIISEHIQSDVILSEHIVADQIDTDHLQANSVTADKIQANSITSDKIQANAITSDKINADSITSNKIQAGAITTIHLDANAVTADKIAAGTITANEIATDTIVAGSGIIADGAIGNAQISELEASKISAGTIDTSKVTIAGTNGNLKISGNRLQVFTGIGNEQYERVSLGDVDGNGSIYGLRVRGADGNTILLDENGVTSEGITDGSITNEKVAGDANIDGAKLNINTVVDRLNADGTKSIVGTKIDVGDGNLSAKLSSITETQTEQGKTISSNSSKISANEKAISLKVDSQTYTTDKEAMTQTLEKHTSDISQLNDSIKLKVEATDITNAINDLEIGGRNLLYDTKNLTSWLGGSANDSYVYDGCKYRLLERQDYTGTSRTLVYKKIDSSKFELLKKGETVTISAWIYINSDKTLDSHANNNLFVRLCYLNSTGTTSTKDYGVRWDTIEKDKWIKVSHTFTLDKDVVDGSDNNFLVALNRNGSIRVAKPKMEIGTKATDWSPAPEDIDNSITTVSNKVSELTTDLEGITGRVSSVETTTQTLEGNVSSIDRRLKDAELKITDEAITSTVSSTVDKKMDGIKVGLKNLLLGTATPVITTGTNTSKQTSTIYYFNDMNNHGLKQASVSYMFRYSVSEGSTGTFRIQTNGAYDSNNGETAGYYYNVTPTINVATTPSSTLNGKFTFDCPSEKGFNGVQLRLDDFNGTITIEDFIIIESGMMVSDWSPSPFDIQNAIQETEAALNDNIDNAIKSVGDDILDNVSKNYTSNGTFTSFQQTVESQFKQTSEDITATFDTVNKYTQDVDGKLQNFQDTVSTYIRFSNNGIDLGKSNSPFTSRLDNEKLAFCQDGNEVAYISNNKMVITTADIDDQLRIGDSTSGFFVWTQGSNGNLTLRWSDK